MSTRTFYILYFIILVSDLIQLYHDGAYRFITKPFIMISLGIFLLSRIRNTEVGNQHTLFFCALIGALLGDIFLLFESAFLWGLMSFLVMQVLYSLVFWQDRKLRKSTWIYGIFLIGIIGTVAFLLWDQLQSLLIPVLIYMLAIGCMSFTAFTRKQDTKGYWWIFLGTVLFVLSDSVLAIHQFDVGIHLGKLTVMTTYGLAQLAIVRGYIFDRVENQ